ncbi:tail fiber protein, partial [Escherichia coli]|nr:tail fiber protein [Escherichia coli]
VANMAESYKPALAEGSGRSQTCRMVIIVSSVASVALTIDTTTVMATQDYVDDKIAEHEQSRRHPDASLTAKGFTQLSSATNSTSETLAATPKAVKAAYDLANGKYTAQDATTARKGLVQLSSATNSTSETLAATPKAVKAAYDLANGKYTAQDATTARKGLVQLSSATNSDSETLAATPKAVKTAYDLANGKYTAQDATTARKGLVQLNSAINSDSETLAATPKAVKSAYDNAEKRLQKDQNGADIPGKDTFTKNIGACRAYSGALSTEAGNWTTAQFIEWLDSRGAFNHPYWMCKCSWSYGNNKIITDTGCGTIHLAGCVIEVMGNKGAMTIRVTTPSTSTGGGTTNAQFTYINHGDAYAPGWRRDYNTKNQQPAFALGQTGSRVANDKAVGWNWNSGVYDADISGASTLILHFNMNAGSCPAVQFRVNYKNGGIFYRSARDGYGFEADWSEFYTTTRKPSAGDVGAYTKAESDSRYVRDIRLGTRVVQTMQKGVMYEKSGHVITGLGIVGEVDGDDPAVFRPIQKYINGTWYNVAQV